MVSGECGHHVLFGRRLTNQIAEKPLVARATPGGLFSSGQSGTGVRVPFPSSKRPLIGIIDHIDWISETLGAATKFAPAGLEISIRIYVTGDSTTQQSDSVSAAESGKGIRETEEKTSPPSLFEDPAIQITRGSRPNLKSILQKEADSTVGGMGVTGLCYRLSIESSPVADHEINTQCVALSLLLLR